MINHTSYRTLAPASELPFLDGLAIRRGRVHELCGTARLLLALIVAQACDGPIFWIRLTRTPDQLFAPGIARYIDPSRLHLVQTSTANDSLWCAEECLRSGQIPLVVVEISEPLALTPVRRLHLAAQNGSQGRRKSAPLGLLLCPGQGRALGVESRWHMQATFTPTIPSWQRDRTRARAEPPASWQITEPSPGVFKRADEHMQQDGKSAPQHHANNNTSNDLLC